MISVGITGSLSAGGFHIAVHDAEALARGNAVVASIDRPSAVYYNPAGLTKLEAPEFQFGAYAVQLNHRADLVSGRARAEKSWQAVPHLYYAHPLNERLTLGAGLNVPFGLETDWSGTALEPYATRNSINDVVFSLTSGVEVNEHFSIGFGVTFHQLDLELGRSVGGLATRFEGDDRAVGYVLSAQWQPMREHSFGATFHSGASFTLNGELRVGPQDIGAELDFDVPDTFAVGYQYRPNSQWACEVNVEWIRWNQLNSYLIEVEAPIPESDRAVGFNWENSWMFEVGVTRYFENGWSASAGYVFNENSQPDGVLFNPAIADADRHWLSAGVGRETGSYAFFLGYQYGFSERTISASFLGGANGEYHTDVHTVSLEGRWKF